jgi:hypothetical protein
MQPRLRGKLFVALEVALLIWVSVACAQKTPVKEAALNETSQNAQDMNEELQFRFTALAKPPVGFGYTYACTVQADDQQESSPKTFIMTVMVADRAVQQQLNEAPTGHVFQGTFTKDEEKVEYRMMPITGFVDQDYTAWKLLKLE